MPTPTIPDGELFFNATLYTGNNSTNVITNGAPGASFQPDLVWIKGRSQSSNNVLQDSVRGVNRYVISNNTGAEGTDGSVTAFNSNGFSLTTDAGVSFNANGTTYVGWQWKAGGAAVTNTAGSISSQVSANTTSGFSVVTYTGTGSNATVGHGLGVTPSMFIIKRRNAAANDWAVYHISTSANGGLALNDTRAYAADSAWFNNTAPTSSVFTVNTSSIANASGGTYVAYCWAPIAGYSAFGSYTGNGSTDGAFVYTGFRPRYVMVKRTDSSESWFVLDTARSPFNVPTAWLAPNLSNAEGTDVLFDILSNGFKQRSTSTNASGGTYIYMAFAENPFKYANAR
jgi:hypothetical protein